MYEKPDDDWQSQPKSPRLTISEVRGAVTPLRLIFWGGLLCLFDITFAQTTNGQGFRFDILNDAVGMAMIAYGVFQLAKVPVSDRYARAMLLAQVMAVIGVVEAVRGHFIVDYGSADIALRLWSNLVGLASLAAIVAFCLAMRWFCQAAGLFEPAASWRMTMILFAVIYAIPLGLVYAAGMMAIVSGTSFNFNLGGGALLLVLVFFVPLVHLFISTSRMLRAAETDGGTYGVRS